VPDKIENKLTQSLLIA